MIGTTLNVVARRLDAVIRRRLALPPAEKKVILSPFLDLDGSVAIKEENTLVLYPVNIQKDAVAGSGGVAVTPPHPSLAGPPPLYLNIYLVLGMYYQSSQLRYGLDLLTTAISILQGQPSWNRDNTPELPPNVDRLIFEMTSLDFHELSHIWGHLGGKYLPSVVYKMRMIIVDDGVITRVTPVISEVQSSGTSS